MKHRAIRIAMVSLFAICLGVLALIANTPNVKAGILATIGCDSFFLVEEEPLMVTVTVTSEGQAVEGKEVKCTLDKGEFCNLLATAGMAKKEVEPRKFIGLTDEDGKIYVRILAHQDLVHQQIKFSYEVDGVTQTKSFRVLGNPPENSDNGNLKKIASRIEVIKEDQDGLYAGKTALVLNLEQNGNPYIDPSQLGVSWVALDDNVEFQFDTDNNKYTAVRFQEANVLNGQPDRCYSLNFLSWVDDSTTTIIRVKVINMVNREIILTQDYSVQKP